MKTINTSNGQFVFVPVEDGAMEVELRKGMLGYSVPADGGFKNVVFEEMPEGDWWMAADTQTVTDVQAAGIVDIYEPGTVFYRDYTTGAMYKNIPPVASLQTLLKAAKLEGRYVILKRVKKAMA